MKKIIVAIDGYSACGKSTTAKIVAAQLNYAYIDSGAMYRAVTLYFHQKYVEITNPKAIQHALENMEINFINNAKTNRNEIYLNGLNVEDEIRKMYISEQVSQVSALPQVRKEMVEQQRRMGRRRGIVMDGRDIGTTVFADAELKIFMTADILTRAYRRQQELLENNELVEIDVILENLKHRDFIDTTRKESPLCKAKDAYFLDTTYMTIDEQVDSIINLASAEIFASDNIQ